MALLAVLQPEAQIAARIRGALHKQHEIIECESWDALAELFSTRPADGCILDIYSLDAEVPLKELNEFRAAHPFCAIIVYSNFVGRELDLYDLGIMGINEVILAQQGDGGWDIVKTVLSALTSSLAARVSDLLDGRVHPMGVQTLHWAIRYSHHKDQPPAMFARRIGFDPNRLRRTLRAEGLPAPKDLLRWGRLFKAVGMIEKTQSTREHIAYTVGYVSMAGLNRAFKTTAGHTIDQIMTSGGVPFLAECFLSRVGGEERESSSGGEFTSN